MIDPHDKEVTSAKAHVHCTVCVSILVCPAECTLRGLSSGAHTNKMEPRSDKVTSLIDEDWWEAREVKEEERGGSGGEGADKDWKRGDRENEERERGGGRGPVTAVSSLPESD